MILLKRIIITPVEEKSLMILSNGILLTDKIKDSFNKTCSRIKKAMEHSINCCLVTLEKSIYNPIENLKLFIFS